jgi:hypothetical protein
MAEVLTLPALPAEPSIIRLDTADIIKYSSRDDILMEYARWDRKKRLVRRNVTFDIIIPFGPKRSHFHSFTSKWVLHIKAGRKNCQGVVMYGWLMSRYRFIALYDDLETSLGKIVLPPAYLERIIATRPSQEGLFFIQLA